MCNHQNCKKMGLVLACANKLLLFSRKTRLFLIFSRNRPKLSRSKTCSCVSWGSNTYEYPSVPHRPPHFNTSVQHKDHTFSAPKIPLFDTKVKIILLLWKNFEFLKNLQFLTCADPSLYQK